MKSLINISISLLIILSCDNLIKEVKEKYDDEKLKVVEYYQKSENDRILVKKRWYYANGEVEKEENYLKGNIDDKLTKHYKDGTLIKEENYKDGKKDGKWSEYKNGKIVWERITKMETTSEKKIHITKMDR